MSHDPLGVIPVMKRWFNIKTPVHLIHYDNWLKKNQQHDYLFNNSNTQNIHNKKVCQVKKISVLTSSKQQDPPPSPLKS